MRVIASPEAADLVRERGGRLYVWVEKGRCCGGAQRLRTSAELRGDRPFERVYDEGFELFFPAQARLPAELHLEARRGRLDAYWDGCAWVT